MHEPRPAERERVEILVRIVPTSASDGRDGAGPNGGKYEVPPPPPPGPAAPGEHVQG